MAGLRRQLSPRMAGVASAVSPLFATLPAAGRVGVCRDKFSRMGSAAAMHQADLPAVRLVDGNDEYRASASKVREAARDFVTWMRAALARL